MEMREWLHAWQFEHNPFIIFDADRDPYLQDAMVENTSLRSILQHIEKPSPYVIFGIRGAGKSSMRIHAEQYLNQFKDKVLVISYAEFNELLSEKLKTRRIPRDYSPELSRSSRFFGRKDEVLSRDIEMTLDDHLDYILKLAIENLYSYIIETGKEEMLRDEQEYAEKFILLMTLYFAPNDFSKKLSTIRNLIRLSGYKKRGGFFSTKQAKQLAGEIYTHINGVPVSLENTFKMIKEIGVGLFDFHGVPSSTENRFTLLKYFMELVQYFGLSGVYLLVDRVDEPTSIKGDPERMRALVTPLLNDQLFQINHLGIILFLPYELHDLKKYYRSDRIKTISSINWSPDNMIRLIEKRMNAARLADSQPIRLTDIFQEEGEKKVQFIVRQLTPRNAFRLLSIIIEQHCEMIDYATKISTEVYESAVRKYLMEKEGY